MKNYKVYKHIFPNNKIYIGITCQKYLSARWRDGLGYKTQVVYRAIQKYGWENIKHEVLFENLTKEEAEKIEIKLISLYKSNEITFGYNIEAGGTHKGEIAQSTRLKLRNSRLGKTLSKETREKISKKNIGKKLPNYVKEKISKANKGKKNSLEQNNKIKYYQNNRHKNHNLKISNAKKGKKKSLEQIIKMSKPVLQLDENGNVINRFYGMHDAYYKTGISYKNIQSCCAGKRYSAGKFRWKYE